MRMYLSSFRLGDHPEHLRRLVGPGKRVAVIANAIDEVRPGDDADRRALAVQAEIDALAGLGLEADELDLREHFDGGPGLRAALQPYGAVWVPGGNTFMLRYAMSVSGADDILVDLVRRDAIVYSGYSAGPCVLAPSLRGVEHCDDPEAVVRTYDAPVVWSGLGLLDYAIVPHVNSPGHPETELVAVVARYYREQGVPHTTLRDGQALVVEGDVTSLV
jgi:dipeptidase E